MKKRQLLAWLLAAAVLLSLTGCGGSGQTSQRDPNAVYYGSEADLKYFPEVNTPLDVQSVYDSLEYNEKMFYGVYGYQGEKNSFLEEMAFEALIYVDQRNESQKELLSLFPSQIRAGTLNSSAGRRNREHEWAELTFLTEKGSSRKVICTYTVSGRTVSFTPVSAYKLQDSGEGLGLRYALGTESLDYTFSFRGPEVTLTRGEQSVTLCAEDFMVGTPTLFGIADPSSPRIYGINSIHCTGGQSGSAYFRGVGKYGDAGYTNFNKCMASYRRDGLLTLVWSYDDAEGKEVQMVRQFVAFTGSLGSLVLTDGENIYYYLQNEDSYLMETMGQGMTEEEREQLENMEDVQVEQMVQKKADLLKDLSQAFQDAGISVQINESTGEISLDATILFATDAKAISQEGKQMLARFMQVYTSVVFNEEYSGFVSRIIVEGHTDTAGTYEHNLALSEERALAVRDFCLSPEAGVAEEYQQRLADSLTAVGYSWQYPIYAADGSVNMAASRRVAFRFVINLETEE